MYKINYEMEARKSDLVREAKITSIESHQIFIV